MISVFIIICIMLFHWLGDFVFQSNWMAQKKSYDLKALTYHVLTYSVLWFLAIWAVSWGDFLGSLNFAITTFIIHWIIDFFTSKINAKLTLEGQRSNNFHNLFVSIGFDQLLHMTQLVLTYYFIFG